MSNLKSLYAAASLTLAIASVALAQMEPRLRLPVPVPAKEPVQAPKTAQPRLQFPSAPAPVNLSVTPQNPGLHLLRWLGPAGSQFRVYRRAPNAPSWTALADGINDTGYYDRAIVAPGTAYRVETILPNTLPNGAEVIYANPPQPEMPQAFRGGQVPTEEVNLFWKAVANATAYRIFGPGMPPDGTFVDMSRYNIQTGGYDVKYSLKLNPGTYTFSITSVYGAAGYVTTGMPTMTVVVTARHSRYRITLNGFRCVAFTGDDPVLQGDGKGDEIYVAAFVGASLGDTKVLTRKVVRTRIYGDVSRSAERIQAGTAGPTGGITLGNAVPSNAGMPLLPVVPATDRLPLLVWEGELWDGDRGIVVVPTVWEWDGDDTNFRNWSGWLMGTRYDWLDVLEKTSQPELWRTYAIGPDLGRDENGVLFYGIAINDSAGRDIPIGYSNIGLFNSAKIRYASNAFLINRSNIENLLGRNSTAMMTKELMTTGGVGGDYQVYLQVERIPSDPNAAVRVP